MENKFTQKLLVIFFFLLSEISFAQLNPYYTKYWVQFTDRNNTPYSVANPSAFLSPRAIQRRTAQSIAVIQNDLPVNQNYIDSVAAVPNVTILNRSKWFNAITIYTTDTNAINTINAFPFVNNTGPVRRLCRNVEGDETYIQDPQSKIKFPFINDLPSENNAHSEYRSSQLPAVSSYSYGPSFNQVDMLGGVCMHNQGYDGAGIQIAVLDIGFYKTDSAAAFDSLWANSQVLGTWNFVDGNSNVFTPNDVHGTWVLSLMAGNIPGQLIGTAPKAKYWLLRTEDGASENVIEEDNWVSGAEFADSVGADILSTSLGYTEFDSIKVNNVNTVNPANHTYADMDGNTTRISIGTDIAASKGMLPVCAAGNMGWSPWHFIGAPADADSVLAVGAVDSLKNYVGFSSKGPSFDGDVKPNVAAQGDHPYTTDLAGGVYNAFSGTSFACPLTAGMVACLWQAHPTATCMQIFNAIQQTASQSANPDTLLGYGIPDFCAANIALGVPENNPSLSTISVYPNPSRGEFTIQSPAFKIEQLEVRDVFGKLISEKIINSKSVTVDLSSFSTGVYMLSVKSDGKTSSVKLVKMK